jgi:hypothetical protein
MCVLRRRMEKANILESARLVRAYTLGSLLNPADSAKVGVGGLELHVWDISGAG